jgi:hypothetical protein
MSVSLSVWIAVCLSHSLALAEYSVYREIDPSTQADAEVCALFIIHDGTHCTLPLYRSPPNPTNAISLPGTVRMMRRMTSPGPVMTTFQQMCAFLLWSTLMGPTL